MLRDVGDDGGVGVDEDEGPAEDSRTSPRTRGFPRLIRIGGVGVVGLLLLRASVILSLNIGEISPRKKGEEGPVLVVDGWYGVIIVSVPQTQQPKDAYRSRLRRPKSDSCGRVPTKNLVKRLKAPSNLRRVPVSVSSRKRSI